MTIEAVAVSVIDDLRAPDLQLHVHPATGAYCALFAWDVVPSPVDAGPPPIVQEILAAALVGCGTVAFLDEPDRSMSVQGWSLMEEDHWLRIPPTFADWLCRRPRLWVRATANPERARRLFHGAVSWDTQQQAAFLFKNGQLADLARRLVVDVLVARDASITGFDLPDEVIALALPAVDGDFLEIVAREPATRDMVRAAIVAECSRHGVAFSVRNALV